MFERMNEEIMLCHLELKNVPSYERIEWTLVSYSKWDNTDMWKEMMPDWLDRVWKCGHPGKESVVLDSRRWSAK